MELQYITRAMEPTLSKAVTEFPAVLMTGPRQSGKTTLVRRIFGGTHEYVSLEPLDIKEAAAADPRGFLELHSPPVIFDEIQYAPALLPYIKEHIDSRRTKTGMFILTGSQNVLLMESVTESLTGRIAVLRLFPLSKREMMGDVGRPLPWEHFQSAGTHSGWTFIDLWQKLVAGWYPEIISNPGRDRELWYQSYVNTYLERDVRTVRDVGDLAGYRRFLRMLAARNGQLLNMTSLANDLGVVVNTVKKWISVLEAVHQVHILQPYYANVGKRLVKTPKIYFIDTGTLCNLTGETDPQRASLGPNGGSILETAVLSEIYKTLLHRGKEPNIFFWRTNAGAEVDFLIEYEGKLVPMEVKLSATPRPAMARNIRRLHEDLGDRVAPGYVVHPGDVTLPLGEGVTAIPFACL